LSSALETPTSPLGAAIRELRGIAKLSQEELGHRSEIHPTLVSNIETGKSNPTLKTLRRLADGLDVPISWIFTLEEIYARRAGVKRAG
jgi:transcriptional regulator with XRE-family HTH domain